MTQHNPDSWLRIASGTAVARWTSEDGNHRVYLIARHDGGFSSYSQYFSNAEFEHCWVQERAGGSFYDSDEIAVREIHGAFPWSREVKREDIA